MNTTVLLDGLAAQDLEFSTLPETVNYHFTPLCNMRCAFCFAGFRDCKQVSLERHKAVIRSVAAVPTISRHPRRLNFVGGEPTVYPYFEELLLEAHDCGLRTSLVSNGFNLVQKCLPESFQTLELLGLSIDSLNSETNRRIGRAACGKVITQSEWLRLIDQANDLGLSVKINTTVTAYNADEDLSAFVERVAPRRWKVFQGMVVEGQNANHAREWVVDRTTFDRFVSCNSTRSTKPVAESEALMRGSYAMISPDGRFFDSSIGRHTYSDSILDIGVERAWRQISFDVSRFDERTRSYSEMEVACAA